MMTTHGKNKSVSGFLYYIALQRWALEELTDLLLKAEVQEAVGLVEHQPAQLIRVERRSALQVVQQPPGGGHQHRHAPPQPCLLLAAVLPPRDGPPNLPGVPCSDLARRFVPLAPHTSASWSQQTGVVPVWIFTIPRSHAVAVN